MPVTTSRIAQISSLPADWNELAGFSNDARWAAYVQDDASGKRHLYLQDTNTGQVREIAAPDGATKLQQPVFSSDGSKLVFDAWFGASKTSLLYTYDLRTSQVQLASSDASGRALGDLSVDNSFGGYDISANGRYLVFTAYHLGSSIFPRDDVYLKDLQTGAFSKISDNPESPSGFPGNFYSPNISDDGRYVLFYSDAGYYPYGRQGWYRKDLQTGATRLASAGDQGDSLFINPQGRSILSGDGSKAVFLSDNAMYLKDFTSGKLLNITALGDGTYINGDPVSISSDGRFLTFNAYSRGQVPGDSDAALDVYQKDLQTGAVQLLTPHGTRDTGANFATQVSSDGQSVLYFSSGANPFGNGGASLPPGSVVLNIAHLSGVTNNNQGDDVLIGSSSADLLAGGNGNDSYWINHPGDIINEAANAGTDLAFSLIQDFTLPDNVENLTLNADYASNVSGVVNAGGSGNNGNNRITGNSQNNYLRGMGGDDVLVGGGGNDTIDGGSGQDMVIYSTNMNAKVISVLGNGMARVSDANGADQLQNVERLVFNDNGFALPGDTHAAQVYRVYQAAFNRTPDAGGLGFWIKQADNGVQLSEIANGFIGSREFKNLYGNAPSHFELVSKFYENVLHRTADAGGLSFWVNTLDSGRADAQTVLAQFAESPENQAALAGVIDHGFSFTLFQ